MGSSDFQFKTKWEGAVQKSGDPFWIALNLAKARAQHGGGLLMTRECTSLPQLEREVERLKAELDQALAEARATLRRLAWSR